MELIKFPELSVVYAKDQPEYNPLPAYRFKDDPEGKIVFCWKLSPEEIKVVQETGLIWHSVMTFNGPLQPQLLTVEKPNMPPNEGN